MTILEVQNLTAGYPEKAVFKQLGFKLREGELRVILGPNGAGKTTLLKCINGLLKPRTGVVRVEGTDVLRLSADQTARRLGYVPQKNEESRLTVFDAVLLGRKPHMGWRVSAQDLQIVDAAIKRLHLKQLSMHYINRISSGELQKVCIARALVQKPKVLLLDEPTASLDLHNQVEIMRTVRMVVEQHPVGVVMAIHDLNLALRFADTFLLLKDGIIQAGGQCEELNAEMIHQAYGVPVEIIRHGTIPVVIPCLESPNP